MISQTYLGSLNMGALLTLLQLKMRTGARLRLQDSRITCVILTLSLMLTCMPNLCHTQHQQISFSALQPYFTKSMDTLNVRENTPVDSVVYTLEAKIDQADNQPSQAMGIIYGIEGTHLFNVNKTSGQVRVAHTIDREQTGDYLTFQVTATPYFLNRPGSPAQLTITIYILDENDNPPKIKRVRVAGRGQEYDWAALVRSSVNTPPGGRPEFSNDNSVESSSDSASRQIVPLIRLNISENSPADSVVVDLIEAIDVDKASTNPLSAVCLDCEPEFELRSRTTSLLNDQLEWSIVLARQLVHVPRSNVRQLHVTVTDGKFNSSIIFEITVDDVQNKPPQFVGSTTCVVRENVPIDTVVMTVQAVDGDALGSDDESVSLSQANRSPRNLGGRQILYDFIDSDGKSSSQQLEFKLHPLSGQIQVAKRLDREAYLSESGVLTLRVRARELNVEHTAHREELYESILENLRSFVDQSDEAVRLADVTVILMDANDCEPHWLNSSEIAALNVNHSPFWHSSLPSDRDTGRNYKLQVRENSPPGSVLTVKNEMFVYDLDSGEHSEFDITLEDPFNLFDVEPKHVTGFASITLKLANNFRGALWAPLKLLDYENINERVYIIQLHAIESRTNEMFRSKAQIQINVVDVNDNAPEFDKVSYSANIREDAPAGKTVSSVRATDRDELSKKITYSLHGKSAYLFDIDQLSGLITVAKCEQQHNAGQGNAARIALTPARFNNHANQSLSGRPCIDFEQQASHHLMVEASDGELSTKVPFTVFIEDVSDNPPFFTLPIIDVVIEEGAERLDPPIKVEAIDADQTSVLTYSIVEGNFEGLFTINNSTGELQLTRPIRIAHDDLSSPVDVHSSPTPGLLPSNQVQHKQMNKMTLIVQASDGQQTANGTIRIDILDANDNSPKFMRPLYEKDITESFTPGQSVLTVRAFDLDRGNNARVSYNIERGSHNQFEINENTGEIFVAAGARPFDATKKDNYTLEIIAYDHGLISKSSSVSVTIRVISTVKRAPEFSPPIQRATIYENTLNNTPIHRMSVVDTLALQNRESAGAVATVIAFRPGPIEALDKNGQPVVDNERLESMFSVSTDTGEVMVNSGLDHDFAAHVNLTIFANYKTLPSVMLSIENSTYDMMERQSMPVEDYYPESTGYLIITVVDDNNNPPIFAAPWSPSQPELSFQMHEELPAGSILTQLVANDADSKISYFKIEPPNEYFELASPQSGLIVTKKPIDYDSLMRKNFLTPHSHKIAGQQQQSAQLTMQQQSNNIVQFNVFVYDSGVPQLSAKAIVSVEILPINDWDCKFEQQVYEARIKENSPPDILVTQVRANDLDFGEQHSTISYQLIGEHKDLFNIDPRKGLITVSSKGSLNLDRERLGSVGVISLTVQGRDEQLASHYGMDGQAVARTSQRFGSNQRSQLNAQTAGRTCSAAVKIFVDDINDNPPLFSQKVYEVTAYDTDSVDVPLVKLIVRDDDSQFGSNASAKLIDSFKILSGNINESFNVTAQGMIYAVKTLAEVLSSTTGQPIELRVQVKQQSTMGLLGSQSGPTMFTDECLVRINLLKINRFAPEWRLDSLKSVVVEENLTPGTVVAQLKCFDKDLPSEFRPDTLGPKSIVGERTANASPIRYWIKENGTNVFETPEFRLDPVTGVLSTRIELDRESQEFYRFVVSCEDHGKPQSLENVSPLYVTVLDVDDNKPEFVVPRKQLLKIDFKTSSQTLDPPSSSLQERHPVRAVDKLAAIIFSVEEHQSKGLQIGELRAVDKDLKSIYPINYCIMEGNEFQEFLLDHVTGILYTNQTLDRERQSSYNLIIKAINDGSNCEDHLALHNNATLLNLKQSTSRLYTKREAPARPNQNQDLITVRVEVLDINDNAPIFKRPVNRAGVHHRSLMNTLVTQVAAQDSDSGANGTLNYKINEILMYKTNPIVQQQVGSRGRYDISSERETLSKPIKLIQSPFRIDQQGNIYTQQLLTQYQLMSMFVLQIEAAEQADPWRIATTKLEIYTYETNNQLKIRINLHPKLVDAYRHELEALMQNATKYTAIINRARSYNGVDQQATSVRQSVLASSKNQENRESSLDVHTNQMPSNTESNELNYSNIHLIFVDNHRIVNPNLVMEKFDLTSAQLFTPQLLKKQFKSNGNDYEIRQIDQLITNDQAQEVSSLIDKIALAAASTADYHGSPSSLIGIDWLESPSLFFIISCTILTLVGLVLCLIGCCCKSRVKDHIIKVAMDKLVKQQTLQAKINERVLAATNQAYPNGNSANGDTINGRALDYMLNQGGLMSSFDATKGCVNNNYENMSILQRAMDAGEFIDPNYLTLNGHVNMGAHYFDASNLDQGGGGDTDRLEGDAMAGKRINGSTISLSMAEDVDEPGDDVPGIAHDKITDNGELSANMLPKEHKLYTNGINGVVSSHSRLRQQVPQSGNK